MCGLLNFQRLDLVDTLAVEHTDHGAVAICIHVQTVGCNQISADGIPRGLELEHDHPQAPRRKGQEQKRDEPCAAHQRQNRNDHTDQDRDTAPKGTGSFHKI